ncbi:hypothetical protein ACFWNN_31655 [Lentzea sp. NPDC058450]|uniref:hypothetical protein n=1 Tax=Lentzea sp. NPDC058450 TaxID=3346505 RepID=UPI00365C2ECF
MKIFHHLTRSIGLYCVEVALGAFAFCIAGTFALALFNDIGVSGWNIVMSQIVRWFLFWVGIYLVHNVLPIAVAHGRTRREFLTAASAFAVVLSLAVTALGLLGFYSEDGIYYLMGWSVDGHAEPLAFLMMFLVWCAAGMFCAAAFDRFGVAGVVAVPISLVLAAVTSARMPQSGDLPFIHEIPELLGNGWHLLSLVAFLVALAGTWAITRDAPVRTR